MQRKHLLPHSSIGPAFETILLAQLHKAKCLDLAPLAKIMGAPTRSRVLPPPFPITSQRSWHFNQWTLVGVIRPQKWQVSHQLVELGKGSVEGFGGNVLRIQQYFKKFVDSVLFFWRESSRMVSRGTPPLARLDCRMAIC